MRVSNKFPAIIQENQQEACHVSGYHLIIIFLKCPIVIADKGMKKRHMKKNSTLHV